MCVRVSSPYSMVLLIRAKRELQILRSYELIPNKSNKICIGLVGLFFMCLKKKKTLGHEKIKPCFTGVTDPYFPFGDFFFFFSLLESCKISQSRRKFGWTFLKITESTFVKFFSEKRQILGKIFVLCLKRAVICATKKKKMSRPTLLGRSVRP